MIVYIGGADRNRCSKYLLHRNMEVNKVGFTLIFYSGKYDLCLLMVCQNKTSRPVLSKHIDAFGDMFGMKKKTKFNSKYATITFFKVTF